MENANSHDYLHKIKSTVIDNIRRTGKPSVEAFMNIPDSMARAYSEDEEDEENDLDADLHPDKRVTQRQRDQQIVDDAEFDDPSDDEEYKDSLGVRRQPGEKRRRNIMEFQNPNALADDGADTPMGARALNGESARTAHQPSPAPPRRSASRASSKAANGTASQARTPAPAADEDGDINMDETDNASTGEEADASAKTEANAATAGPSEATFNTARASQSHSPAGVVTPPESPGAHAAAAPPAPASATATADVEMAEDERAEQIQEIKDEGLKERTEEAERGEAQTEAEAAKVKDEK